MLQADELLASREGAHAFEGFAEGPIRFAPTYKFDRGTDTLDSSKKRRAQLARCSRGGEVVLTPLPRAGELQRTATASCGGTSRTWPVR